MIKTLFFLTITIVLAVALEAMTMTSVKEFDSINTSFQELSSNHKTYDKNVSLSEIIYNEKSTKGLMNLIINEEIKTFNRISYKKFIQDVYQRNRYVPLWFDNKGIKREALLELFNTIKSDITLNKKSRIVQRYKALEQKIANVKVRNLDTELELDLQLSALYRSYLGYHIYGAIEWVGFQQKLSSLRRQKIAANWVTNNPQYDIADLMLRYPLSHIVSVTTPSSFNYHQLLNELNRLRSVQNQGGWKKIPNSSQLVYGKSGTVVKQLIERLRSEGDYRCKHDGKVYTYDNCLKKAVQQFQKRHGLYVSGKINAPTRNKLNLSVEWKIEKILLNLDRIKRLPDQAEDRYVVVNIPDFKLYYKEYGQEKLNMRVIVGDKTHHTPIFSNQISFIVLNPYWLIPDSIVQKEMIPNILKNPDYLAQRGYEVRKDYALARPPIDTSTIDWAQVLRSGQTNNYKFMQPPGPKNALGKIKFKFPNQFAVYLHDTPTKKLFNKAKRAFSHGCIRIAEPNALLATFAPHERSINYNQAKRVLKGKTKMQLNLSQHVPVHIVYLTAWVHSDGLLHYRNDVYNYDSKQHRVNH
ncbi:L,D-transpeptidase family protein [bacterium]|nr:L,D-transpeptidase family protein [bacterium]MBU1958111.1 L,D-transpeptidase family protein [bacterium]